MVNDKTKQVKILLIRNDHSKAAFKFVQDHRHKLSQQNNEQSTLEKREFFNRGVKKWRTKYKLTL